MSDKVYIWIEILGLDGNVLSHHEFQNNKQKAMEFIGSLIVAGYRFCVGVDKEGEDGSSYT